MKSHGAKNSAVNNWDGPVTCNVPAAHDTVKYSTWTPRELESRCLQRNTNNVPFGRRHRIFVTTKTPAIDPARYQNVLFARPSVDCDRATPNSLLIKPSTPDVMLFRSL